MRRCAYMRDDQILMIYQLTKILTSNLEILDSCQDFDSLARFSLGNELNKQNNDVPLSGGDINLSLNSNSNADKKLEDLNDSDWGMDQKGILFFIIGESFYYKSINVLFCCVNYF